MKRRIIYKENKATKETKIISVEVSENLEDIELKFLDLEYEIDKEKFDRAKKFHIEDNKIIFDELYFDTKKEVLDNLTKQNGELEEHNKELQKETEQVNSQLLEAQELLVNNEYKNLIGGDK